MLQAPTAIPAFNDNYIWAIRDGDQCVIVDPGDAAPVEAWLSDQGLTLSALLITHHHPDHVGGVSALCRDRDIPVYGNMMINSSTFCFHCGDLPTQCDYSCALSKKLIMENEEVEMVGRALTSVNRMDFREYLGGFPNVGRASIMDLDLTLDEVAEVAESLTC